MPDHNCKETSSDFLEDTLDNHQKTKRVSKDELFVWRFCLIKRFELYSKLGVKLTIENQDFSDQTLGLFDPNIPDSKQNLPNNLSKTVLRLKDLNSTPERQLLVVTLYIKKPADIQGTILVQGSTCSYFGVQEFNSLNNLVKSTPQADHDSFIDMYSHLQSIPLNRFNIDIGTSRSKSDKEIVIDHTTEVNSIRRDSRRMSHRFLSVQHSQESTHEVDNPSKGEQCFEEMEEMIYDVTSQKIDEIFPRLQQEMKKQLTIFHLQMKNEQKAVLMNLELENEDLKALLNHCNSGVLIPSLSVYRLLIFRIKVGTTSRSLLYDLNSKSRGGPTKIFYS